MSKSRKNSVRSLASLYTVIIGVALTFAVSGLIDPAKGLEGLTLTSCLLFVAFSATLVPFYHGALRHLDDAFIEGSSKHIKDGALIVDIGLLFLHALVFVVLALLLKKPGHFAWTLSALLGVDVVWGVFAYFGSSSKSEDAAEWKWMIINLVFVSGVATYLVLNDIYLNEPSAPLKLSLLLMVLCLLRTVVDYCWCRRFYFPVKPTSTRAPSVP